MRRGVGRKGGAACTVPAHWPPPPPGERVRQKLLQPCSAESTAGRGCPAAAASLWAVGVGPVAPAPGAEWRRRFG